jgi:DNA-binding NarL/FixJ family response regulator
MVKVLVVDDHAPTRREMILLIGREPNLEVVGEAATGEDAVAKVKELHPDVVVMDILLPGITGVEATRIIAADSPGMRIVALSNHSGRNLVQAVLRAGGMGYVRKDHAFEELVPAIRSIAAGERFLGRDVED